MVHLSSTTNRRQPQCARRRVRASHSHRYPGGEEQALQLADLPPSGSRGAHRAWRGHMDGVQRVVHTIEGDRCAPAIGRTDETSGRI